MRYAIIGDLHGRHDHLRLVLQDAARRGVDEVLSLGDIFDVRVPKSNSRAFTFTGLEAVVDAHPDLVALLGAGRTVRGNQEDRILELVPPDRLPPALSCLGRLPSRIWIGDACLEHGHRFEWPDYAPGVGVPAAEGVAGRVAFYGHNHQNVAFQPAGPAYTRLEVTPGVPLALCGPGRYLLNVATIHWPAWVLYDDAAAAATYYLCAGGGSATRPWAPPWTPQAPPQAPSPGS